MVANYFDLPEVSASELKELRATYYGLADRRENLEEVFNFGSLVDAMLTERERLDYTHCSLKVPGSLDLHFSPIVWRQAERLAEALRKDPVVALLIKVMTGQYIFRRTISFTYQGEEYSLRGRCKFDGFAKPYKTGLEYKTTAAKTLREFLAAIDFFAWDMSAAWYMDLARIDYFWIIAVSKSSGEVFKRVVERGDETYKLGVQKYSVWAYRWTMLVDPFVKSLKLVS